ncbi:diadenylate cyclase [Clostridium lundense]|uniref:diadenylate cyclase n=1 Tax=Clostridium lundense TaxID=319475 RepID=UPI0006872264|nr:diadenylate cyclase [Clostridium lundense]
MSKHYIKYFMWGYQTYMRISLQIKAQYLFERFDKDLKPEIQLVGILDEESDDKFPVCVEIDSDEESEIESTVIQYLEINTLAEELRKVDPNSNMLHSDPLAQENYDKIVRNNSYRKAIENIILKSDYSSEKKVFISVPVRVEGYLVFVVLKIDKQAYERNYSLRKNNSNRYFVYTSLLEALCMEYLNAASMALFDPNRGFESITVSDDELIRNAARKLMFTAATAGDNIHGVHGLYDTCNEIASMRYEGVEGVGSIIIAKQGHKNIRMKLQLKRPINISDHRKVRKFLEMSGDDASIITDSSRIYGLGELKGAYNPVEESVFEVRFIDHYEWMLLHNDSPMMIVKYGNPTLPKEVIKRSKFYSDASRMFSGISERQIDSLWDIVTEATKQKHGTMLVISQEAKEESVRLGNQCFEIEPQKLPLDMINQVTAIDGALLIDPQSNCYATGVILDGLATDKGDSSRGARYNSAIRYHEYIKNTIPTMLVIISEDGMINLIPDLRPQIEHSDILKNIEKFRELSTCEEPSVKMFNQLMKYFTSNEFYLTSEECKEINKLRVEIESGNLNSNVRILYSDLESNTEMNESYYLS